ncbi:MAG: glutathione peroxidase [Bacteriovoracaceae bacterium]
MKIILILGLLINWVYAQDIYSINDKTINGEDFKFESLKGKTVLVVNIASQCGFTGQLDGLEKLYQKYKSKNFVVLGVPTNDFGGQTPEDDKKMLEFCQKNYQVTFPILTKRTVKGEQKRELYRYLTEKVPKEYQGEISWNFVKFLISKEGKILGRYSSFTSPDSKDLISTIESSL